MAKCVKLPYVPTGSRTLLPKGRKTGDSRQPNREHLLWATYRRYWAITPANLKSISTESSFILSFRALTTTCHHHLAHWCDELYRPPVPTMVAQNMPRRKERARHSPYCLMTLRFGESTYTHIQLRVFVCVYTYIRKCMYTHYNMHILCI